MFTLAITASICLGTGLVLNQIRDRPLPLVYISKQSRIEQVVNHNALVNTANQNEPTGFAASASNGSPQIISLAEFRDFVQTKRGVVLDARAEIFHRLGHVPGALSLSREEFESDYARRRAYLEPRRDEPIAVYCSDSGCEDSIMVANALHKLGYQHVLVFKGGWNEWTNAGLVGEHQ